MPEDHRHAQRRPRHAAVTLREGTFNGVWSRLSATVEEDGTLVISGHLIGPRTSPIGDEFEFWIRVEGKYLPALGRHLGGLLGIELSEQATVPDLLKVAYGRGEFTSGHSLIKWMKQKRVPSSFSSWP